MFRLQLLSLIRQEAQTLGYDFQNGFLYRTARSNFRLPVLWMEPPVLTGVEGRDEGTITYHITLHLMTADRKYDEIQKEEQWETMETQALGLLNTILLQGPLFSLEKIRCTPSEFDLTNRGELSLKVEFEARTAFPEENSAESLTI